MRRRSPICYRSGKSSERKLKHRTQNPSHDTTDTSKQNAIRHLIKELAIFRRNWKRVVPFHDDHDLLDQSLENYEKVLRKIKRDVRVSTFDVPSSLRGRQNENRESRPETPSPVVRPEKRDIRVFPGPPRSDPATRSSEPSSSHRSDPVVQQNISRSGTRIRQPEYRSKRRSRSRDRRLGASLHDEKSYDQFDRNSGESSSFESRLANGARQLKSSLRSWID